MDARHAPDNLGDVPGRDGRRVNQYGDGSPEYLVAAPRDDNPDSKRNDRIEPDISEPDQKQPGEHRATDQHVAARVRGVGDQESALQPPSFTLFVNGDDDIA